MRKSQQHFLHAVYPAAKACDSVTCWGLFMLLQADKKNTFYIEASLNRRLKLKPNDYMK